MYSYITKFVLVDGSKVTSLHNNKRTESGVPPLKSSFKLTNSARKCALFMANKNLDGASHPCNPGEDDQGENIYQIYADLPSSSERINDMMEVAVNAW